MGPSRRGIGGRNGMLIFKHVGIPNLNGKNVSTPIFINSYGSVGKMGKDAPACKSLALDIRIDAELKKVVFIYLPLHHSFSSRFFHLNHVNSSKCFSMYVKSEETINVVEPEPSAMGDVLHVVRYKRFLLENMKNDSLTAIAEKTYKAIDEHREINEENSLNAIVLEACELENYYFELRKSVDFVSMYERLSNRVNGFKLRVPTEDDRLALSRLQMILSEKSRSGAGPNFIIVNLPLHTGSFFLLIEIKSKYAATPLNIADVELRNKLDQLLFGVNGNDILEEYNHIIDTFQLNYFPFAVDYLEAKRLPTSYMNYKDLKDISSAATNELNTMLQSIEVLNSNSLQSVRTDPGSTLYIWKNADFRDEIEKLFYGEKITLMADIKQSKNQFNAYKLNTIGLNIRLSEPTQPNHDLEKILKSFTMSLNHTGSAAIRCNDKFYQLTNTGSISLLSSFAIYKSKPSTVSTYYSMLEENHPLLSPYTLWEIHLDTYPWEREKMMKDAKLAELRQFAGLVDIELRGTGKYIEENALICENENLSKFYSLRDD